MGLRDLSAQAARATGLSTTACRELLAAGWELRMNLGQPAVWVDLERVPAPQPQELLV